VFGTPCADFSRPVEELEYTYLLKSSFTEASHDRGHMDPNISKATTVKERVVAACTESQSTLRVPNRTRFVEVQAEIRAKIQCDKKSLLAATDESTKRNLMVVRGHADNTVDLCGEENTDAKRQCLGKGQTMPTKPPSQYGDGETRYGSRVTMSA
jgi:hypothetical protein